MYGQWDGWISLAHSLDGSQDSINSQDSSTSLTHSIEDSLVHLPDGSTDSILSPDGRTSLVKLSDGITKLYKSFTRWQQGKIENIAAVMSTMVAESNTR